MKTTIWAARDKNGELNFFGEKPKEYIGGTFYDKSVLKLNEDIDDKFKWITYDISPVELNLVVSKRKHKTNY